MIVLRQETARSRADALSLSHLTCFDTTITVRFHRLDHPPFPCKRKIARSEARLQGAERRHVLHRKQGAALHFSGANRLSFAVVRSLWPTPEHEGDAPYTSAVPVLFVVMVFAGLVGLILGSFMNVLIVRLPGNESVVMPRSHCRGCKHPIRWYDNVPVLSFFLLGGRCRHCGERISPVYPAVEAASALWFMASLYGPARELGARLDGGDLPDALWLGFVQHLGIAVLGWLLIGLAVTDWQTGLLPDELTLGGAFVGLLFAATESFFVPPVRYKTFFTPEEVFIFQRVGATAAAFLLLYLLGRVYHLLRKRPGIGRGDVKMLAMLAAFLGFAQAILALFAGVLLASVYAVRLLLQRRATATTALPFGTFLAAGGLFAALAGPELLDWYLGLFR